MWLRSSVALAVAVASSCSFNLTRSLGTSICQKCGSKKQINASARAIGSIKPLWSCEGVAFSVFKEKDCCNEENIDST